jgi:tRNA U34 5-carboxymethylaminomethyl modifying enzyme MnmG/GidA
MELKKQVDVCVVGAGHAGCEALVRNDSYLL